MRRLAVLALLLGLPWALAAPAVEEDEEVFGDPASARSDLAEARERAARRGRRVLVEWGANWCGWCQHLHDISHADEALAAELAAEFEVVPVNVGERVDEQVALSRELGADYQAHGIPYLTVLEPGGGVVTNQGSRIFNPAGERFEPELVRAWLEQHRAPRREADAVLDAALAEAVEVERRVLLLFGSVGDPATTEVLDWLERSSTRSLLARAFVPVFVDTDRDRGAPALMEELRGAGREGTPAFVALDADGSVVRTTDRDAEAPTWPWPVDDEGRCPEEGHFRAFLRATGKGLLDLDIEHLGRTLRKLVEERPESPQPESRTDR